MLSCLALTISVAGPRAWAVTRARAASLQGSLPVGPRVDLDRVGFVELPTWLRGDVLTLVALDLAPALGREVGLTDDAAAAAFLLDLRAVAWVRDAALQRVYPDRLLARLTLRQPVIHLAVDGRTMALDGDGMCLPCPPRTELPVVELPPPHQVAQLPIGVVGQLHPDACVRAAAAVAAEWARDIAPRWPAAPVLRSVDATNLGYRADPARLCEVRVALARADGQLVWFDYDHPPASDAPRVPATHKVAVLQQVLAAYPGLLGVARADLRFKQRWQAWIELDAGVPPR